MTAHEPFAEWSALAAVGALDGDEQRRFQAHLAAGCGECERGLAEMTTAAASLPLALPIAHPPAHVRDRLLARVGEASGAARSDRVVRGRPARRWRWGAAVAVAAGLAALTWGIWDTRAALERQRAAIARLEQELAGQRAVASLVSGTDTAVIALAGSSQAARAEGFIVWSPGMRRGHMVVHYLPALPSGQQYQLWAFAADRPSPAGVFDVDALGHAAITISSELERPARFAVTIEPRGGLRAPTGPIAMAGAGPR